MDVIESRKPGRTRHPGERRLPTLHQAASIYQRLHTVYGARHWWPADTPFEVMLGAILTQNAAWTNVEKALTNLKAANALTPRAILDTPQAGLARLIRPSGYFNQKAARLKRIAGFVIEHGGIEALRALPVEVLRLRLLAINGVGPETADSILLYALNKPVFVIDAYTRRIFSRLGHVKGDETYEELRDLFERSLPARDTALYNEYHALIVEHAKQHCRVKPVCRSCPVSPDCGYP